MDAIALHAASDNVERMMKKVAGRMGFDKDPGQVADAAAKKDKDKSMKALTRNLAKCSHANPIIAADYLINYVSCSLLQMVQVSTAFFTHCWQPIEIAAEPMEGGLVRGTNLGKKGWDVVRQTHTQLQ